jgi:hypothetical protein
VGRGTVLLDLQSAVIMIGHGKEQVMRKQQRFHPGTPAPEAAWYAELDATDFPTNTWVSMAQGELLPSNPEGVAWRKAEPTTPAKLERGSTSSKPRGDLGWLRTSLHEPDDLGGLPASTD